MFNVLGLKRAFNGTSYLIMCHVVDTMKWCKCSNEGRRGGGVIGNLTAINQMPTSTHYPD